MTRTFTRSGDEYRINGKLVSKDEWEREFAREQQEEQEAEEDESQEDFDGDDH